MRRTILVLTATLFTVAFTGACNRAPDPVGGQSPTSRASRPAASSTPLTSTPLSTMPLSTSASVPASTSTDPVTVRNAGHGTLEVEYADGAQRHRLRGTSRESGKRKYTLDNGAEVLEVKSGNGSFKVRTPDGRLLWKVKMDPTKVKVSDNEENRDAAELRSGAKGILDVTKIPIMQRAVIYAELTDRMQ